MNAVMPPVVSWPPRYELLDGLRGLAALAVVLHHLRIYDEGHFAVMVFFVISGYCITAAAESCLRRSSGFWEFMRRRLHRIYPPYLLAIAFFAVTRLVKSVMGGHSDLHRSVLDWVQNLTLTQWLSDLSFPIGWPADNPTLFVPAFWSLNYEEQFYLIMALGIALTMRRQIPLFMVVIGFAVTGLVWNWRFPGHVISGLFIEYWVHFALGACLFYVLCRFNTPRVRGLFVTLTVALAVLCAARSLPWTGANLSDMRAMVEICCVSVATLALFWLRPWSADISRSIVWRPIAALGTVSYSLYLIHQFNLNLVSDIAHRLLWRDPPGWLLISLMVSLHVGLATIFWYFCERPFVRRVTHNTGSRQRPASVPFPRLR